MSAVKHIGQYLGFGAAECACACGVRKTFSKRPFGPDQLAREAGWFIRWAPLIILCPKCAAGPVQYGAWSIHYDPPPIPNRNCDWHFSHEDFDGAPDAGDNRTGHAPSLLDAMRQIDDYEKEAP